MVRPMVHSEKHYTQNSLFALTAGTDTAIQIISAVAVKDKDIASEVEEGSSIKAVYIELWVSTNTDNTTGSFVIIVEKQPSGSGNPTTTNMALLNDYANKRNILYTTQGLNNPKNGVAIPALKFWVKIPKGKQRFGLGDKLIMTVFSQTGTLQACGFQIFKEYK